MVGAAPRPMRCSELLSLPAVISRIVDNEIILAKRAIAIKIRRRRPVHGRPTTATLLPDSAPRGGRDGDV